MFDRLGEIVGRAEGRGERGLNLNLLPSPPWERGCPDLIGTGEGLLPPPASRLRGAVRRPRDPSTDGLTDHSAVPSITSAHKLINMEDEIPRSHYARSGITPCLLAR
jgi:hypothetical protein